jgi:hypothetical protein
VDTREIDFDLAGENRIFSDGSGKKRHGLHDHPTKGGNVETKTRL